MNDQMTQGEESGPISFKRLAPLAVLIGGVVLFYALGFDSYVRFETLRENRMFLVSMVAEHAVLAGLIYMAAYVLVVAFSLPGGALMTITGGFLFGSAWGTVWVVISATIGATILFIVAKSALGDPLRAKAGPWMQKMEAGFRENALNYLLVLRLIPLFPFFVVNLVPAFLGVSLRIYFIGTLFGIIPGSFVYATVGAGLGSIFDSGEAFSLQGILTPEIVTALIGLAVLAVIPVIYKKYRARGGRPGNA